MKVDCNCLMGLEIIQKYRKITNYLVLFIYILSITFYSNFWFRKALMFSSAFNHIFIINEIVYIFLLNINFRENLISVALMVSVFQGVDSGFTKSKKQSRKQSSEKP